MAAMMLRYSEAELIAAQQQAFKNIIDGFLDGLNGPLAESMGLRFEVLTR